MPTPMKHPSVRKRRNNTKADFRTLSTDGVPEDERPEWPLSPDVEKVAQVEAQRDRVAALQVELEKERDGRKKGRIRKELNRLEIATRQLELVIEQSADAERELWDLLWATPQAVLWQESHADREVAQYVRWKIRAEQGHLDSGKEARMLSDRLGLNPKSLLQLRAEIEEVEKAERENERRRNQGKDQGGDPAEGDDGDDGDGDDPRLALVK